MTDSALSGMVVLDLTQIMAGPFCTMTLADMGANVIKVEKPNGGDDNRRMGPPFIKDWSAGFLALNRNKRSLVLDLRNEEGQAVFKRLVKDADAVVENFRPGAMDRLGLGYEALAAIKPSLVYCSVSGFGNTGPDAKKGGFDLVAQGVSGLMSITGHPSMPPAKVGVPITDISAGLLAANGVLCAYIHALKTGQGQQVDTSLMEAGVAYTVWESSVYFAEGEISGPLGSAHRVSAPYQALRTSDGYLNIGAATQPTWEQLCRAIGLEALITDSRFILPGDRKSRQDELAALLEETFTTDTTSNWRRCWANLQHGPGLQRSTSAGAEDASGLRRPGPRNHPQHRHPGKTVQHARPDTHPRPHAGRTQRGSPAGIRLQPVRGRPVGQHKRGCGEPGAGNEPVELIRAHEPAEAVGIIQVRLGGADACQ